MALLKDLIITGASRFIGDALFGNLTADSIKKTGGTSAQFLKADGSVDSISYYHSGNKPSASDIGAALASHNHDTTYLKIALKGAVNGVASLDANGKIPAAQLPSYVDDVEEYAKLDSFPATGESGKIYVAIDSGKTYRWSGSLYTVISETLALGTTSSTAASGTHIHGNITNDGKLSTANQAVVTGSDSKITSITYSNFTQNLDTFSTISYNTAVTGINTGFGFDFINGKVAADTVNYPPIYKFTGLTVGTTYYRDYVSSPTYNIFDGNTTLVNGGSMPATVASFSLNSTLGKGYFVATTTSVYLVLTQLLQKMTSGKKGLVPNPNDLNSFLKSDGTWVNIDNLKTTINTDTKNSAGATNKVGTKMYLVGATSLDSYLTTYSNSNCYIGTDNSLYSGGQKVLTAHQEVTNSGATLSWGTTSTIASIGNTNITITMPSNPNTWRGIQDNLTSDSATDSLSAKQGKALKGLLDTHEHSYIVNTKDITDVNQAKESQHLQWFAKINKNQSTNTAGTTNAIGFPVSNSANGILWLGTHAPNSEGKLYGGLLGISSNSNLYYRYNIAAESDDSRPWNRIVFASELGTVASKDLGFTTNNANRKYAVSAESDKLYTTVPLATLTIPGLIKVGKGFSTKSDGTLSIADKYIAVDDLLLGNSPFASHNRFYISKINNRLYAADQRFVVTHTKYNSSNQAIGTLSTNLFDGNYEKSWKSTAGEDHAILYIGLVEEENLATNTLYLWTYNSGKLIVSFYWNYTPNNERLPIKAEIYTQAHSSGQPKGWREIPLIESNITTTHGDPYVFDLSSVLNTYVTAFRITYDLTKSAENGTRCPSICLVEYYSTRSQIAEESAVTKHAITLDLYGEVIAPKFTVRNGKNTEFLKADGSLDSNTYLTELPLKSSTKLSGAATSPQTYNNTKTYPVSLDSNGKLAVVVPWSDSGASHGGYTATNAAAVKVGRDANGHVVFGDALTASDVGALSSSHTNGNGTLTIKGGGTSATTFTADQTSNATIDIVGSGGTSVTASAGKITISSPNLKTGYNTNGKNYAVVTDTNGNLYVNVPWTGTTSNVAAASHTHGNINNDGTIGTEANKLLVTTTNGLITTCSPDTAPFNFVKNDDSRLSDARVANGGHADTAGTITNLGSAATKNLGYTTNNASRNYAVQASGNNLYVNVPWTAISTATDTAIGGVKIGYSNSGTKIPVELDNSDKMYVDVPQANWTETDPTDPSYINNKPIITDSYVDSVSFADNNGALKISLGRIGTSEATITQTVPLASASTSGIVPKISNLASAPVITSDAYILAIKDNAPVWEKLPAPVRGTGIYKTTTAPAAFTTVTNGVTPAYRIAQSAFPTTLKVGDVVEYSYFHYGVITTDPSYAYLSARTSIKGATGAGATVSSTSITYLASSVGTTAPTGNWSSSIPAVNKGLYLWTKTVVNYSDSKSTTTYSVAYQGEDGTSVKILGTYATVSALNSAHSSGNSIGDGYLIGGNLYVWNGTSFTNVGSIKGPQGDTGPTGKSAYEIYLDHGGTLSEADWLNSLKGVSPAALSVSKTEVSYAQNNSNTTKPSSWSTTPPTATANYYMWTKTVVTYSDGNTSTSYSVSKNGADGTSVTGPRGYSIFAGDEISAGTTNNSISAQANDLYLNSNTSDILKCTSATSTSSSWSKVMNLWELPNNGAIKIADASKPTNIMRLAVSLSSNNAFKLGDPNFSGINTYIYGDAFNFMKNNSQIMVLDGTGLGINNATPKGKLHVNGTAIIEDSSLEFLHSNYSWKLYNDSDKNLLIGYTNTVSGTGSNFVAKLTIKPDGNITGAGNFYTSSDIRYKDVKEYIDISTENLAKLPVFTYSWKNEPDFIHVGSSALAVKEIIPELVSHDDSKDFYSLDYATLGAVGSIIAAREIEELKKRIKELEEIVYGRNFNS